MQTLFRHLFIALAFASFGAVAATEPKTHASIDLDKTRALVKSWTLRKTFPDWTTFAYYYADSSRILDGGIEPESKVRLVDFLKRCQRDDGGFAQSPKFANEPNIVYTYYALDTLHLLGADQTIDRAKVLGFVQGLLDAGGGIRAVAEDKHGPTLASTFYGVEALRLLQGLDILDAGKTTAFVLSHRTSDDGGFAVTTKGPSRPRSTSMAVRTLATLGTLTETQKDEAIQYLESAIALVGTKGPQFRAFSSMQAITAMVEALDRLEALDDVITDRLVEFVKDRYVPQNGGFGPAPGLGTTPASTYQGLLCLEKLGALPKTTPE